MRNDRQRVESIKEKYPLGTRIELGCMKDPYAPVPPGTKGTVEAVDDAASLLMKWDNGRSLALIPAEDSFTVISRPQQQALQDEPEQNRQMGGMKFE